MIYVGGKTRIAKENLLIILADRKPGQAYVEPFVGGANSIDKVDGIRIGGESSLSANGKVGGNKQSVEKLFHHKLETS